MGDSIGNNRPKTVVEVSGDEYRVQAYNKANSLNSEHNYLDNLKEIKIFFGDSSLVVNRPSLDQNIHNVRTIFSECINDNVNNMSVRVFAQNNLKKYRSTFEHSNSIHVDFDSRNQVLVYLWPISDQFDENKWNNFLLQLEGNPNLEFIGTGVLQFKYKGFNYFVYPPFFKLHHGEAFDHYKSEVFSFSRTEISQIIEDIKESHPSIEKKIIDHYKSLGKSFAENDTSYIYIKAGIDGKNVKNFTDVSYTNISDGIRNNPIEEAFIKEEEIYKAGNLLHDVIYMNNESFFETLLKIPSYDVNAVNTNGRTPLHLAAKYGKEGMVKMLLGKNAEVDIRDNRGRTPLHLAAQYNEKKEIVEMLLNQGAKVDIADSRGRTPLHFAAVNGHKEVVEVLLKAEGINVNAVDEDGKTPLDLTTKEEIKTLLKNAEKSDDGDSSTDNEGDHEEDTGKEKQADDVQPGSEVIKKENSEEDSQKGQGISAEEGTDLKTEGVGSVAYTESAQTEEQPSSFFGSFFSILTNPFSLIASFFSGFFLWLFSSNIEKADEFTSQSDVSLLTSNSLDDDGYNDSHYW